MLRTAGFVLMAAGLVFLAAGFILFRKPEEETIDLTSDARVYDRLKIMPGERYSADHAGLLVKDDRTELLDDNIAVTVKLDMNTDENVTEKLDVERDVTEWLSENIEHEAIVLQ